MTAGYGIRFANIKGQAMRFTRGMQGGSRLRPRITLSEDIDQLERVMHDAYTSCN